MLTQYPTAIQRKGGLEMHNWHGYHYFGSPYTETSNEQRCFLFSDRFDKLDDPARKCPARRWKMTGRRCRRSAGCCCCRAADRRTVDDFPADRRARDLRCFYRSRRGSPIGRHHAPRDSSGLR